MGIFQRRLRLRFSRGFSRIAATKLIVLSFVMIILLGALLLTLPVASRSGVSCGFLPALFTATSATCVTGLVLFDTFVQWSGFGQIVILLLIQIGGLGFMSATSIFFFLLRKKVGMKQRMVMAQSIGMNDIEGVVRLERKVLLTTFSLEGIGALILFLRFFPKYGLWNGLKWGVFHAISAFCNAGFDIFGVISPGSSVMVFATDPVVMLTLSALIILGGLGFFVIAETMEKRKFRDFSIYTKLVLILTGALLLSGWALFCVLEWNNPATLGTMTTPQKLLAGFFQSATLRTAGFAGIDQGAMTEASRALAIVYMLIGGSSGSTAGGLKTVTAGVMVLYLRARLRGKNRVHIFGRMIPDEQVTDAATLTAAMIGLCFLGGIVLSASGIPFLNGLFEAASALGTVGLSAGVTASMNTLCKLLIILYMFFGRVGIMTISFAFLSGNQSEERIQYAKTKLMIG